MKNKRRYKRLTIKSIGDFYYGDDNRSFKAFVGGISRGGLEFYSEEAIKPGQNLKISLKFKDKSGEEVTEVLTGQIRWSAPFQDAYIAGVQFDVIVDGKATPALDRYIELSEQFYK